MSYKASFLDNQLVGVDDFNGIVSNLVGAGVVTTNFTSAESYMISKMNDVTKDAIKTAGVVPESEGSLRCTLSGTTLSIAVGSAVFASGVNFRVTETEQVQIESGKTQYVYLKHDKIQNTAMPYVSEGGFPNESDTLYIVKLCEVDEAGNITDRREYARGKLQAPNDWNGTKAQTMKVSFTEEDKIPYRNAYKKEIELNVGGDGINFLVVVSDYGSNVGGSVLKYMDGIGIVTEPEHGTFKVTAVRNDHNSSRISESDTQYLYSEAAIYLANSSTDSNCAFLYDFHRDENGRLLCYIFCDFESTTSHEWTFTLYSSVYNEGAEG